MERYDSISDKWVEVPDGWVENRAGFVRKDGRARCVVTGPHGRWVAELAVGNGWRAVCGGRDTRRPSYFKSLLTAVKRAEDGLKNRSSVS